MSLGYKNVNFSELKKGGFIRQQGPDLFIMRLRSIGGHLTSRDLENIALLAKKYGRGEVHLTTRQWEILEVLLKEGEPMTNVPRSLKSEGHRVLQVKKIRPDTYLLIVERGKVE